jgi:hypothetical protein
MTTKITLAALIVAVLGGALVTVAEAHKFAPPPRGFHNPAQMLHTCDGTIGCGPGFVVVRCRHPGPCIPK